MKLIWCRSQAKIGVIGLEGTMAKEFRKVTEYGLLHVVTTAANLSPTSGWVSNISHTATYGDQVLHQSTNTTRQSTVEEITAEHEALFAEQCGEVYRLPSREVRTV
jgi:hypothetical protein